MLRLLLSALTALSMAVAGFAHSGENAGAVSVYYSPNSFTGEADEYNAEISDDTVRVIFAASEKVTDFKILSLVLETVEENGVSYVTEEVYSQAELNPGKPLIAGLEFIGDMPNNGVSYVDSSGATRRFTVDMSCRDGSLYLAEF